MSSGVHERRWCVSRGRPSIVDGLKRRIRGFCTKKIGQVKVNGNVSLRGMATLLLCLSSVQRSWQTCAGAPIVLRGARHLMMMAGPTDTPEEILAKRAARAQKRAWELSPEGQAAAAAAAQAEADAKRERRRARDEREAELLRGWGVRDSAGALCSLVDIGANLVKVKSEGSLGAQLARCQLAGVNQVLITGTSVTASQRALEVARAASGSGVTLFCTAGVHPHEARTCDAGTIAALRELIAAPEVVAVGECGLDYDRMFSTRDVQLEWFEQQARLAVELDKPLFIHERDVDAEKGSPLGSHADLLRVLDGAEVRPERVCIHCFTGDAAQLRAYVSRGYFVGLTGFAAMRERGAHVRAALAAGDLPLEQLMIETDSPFMRPDASYLPDIRRLRQGQNEPCCLPAVCNAVAECCSLRPDVVARATTQNAQSFFGLSSQSQ